MIPVHTDQAPQPVGHYSAAIIHNGVAYISGQTPRLATGERITDAPFDRQIRVALENVEAVARAAGTSLRHGIHVTVYLRDQARGGDFDKIYREFVTEPLPARAIVQSNLVVGEVEISAIVAVPDRGQEGANHES